MTFLRLLSFFLAFTLEVRVKAEVFSLPEQINVAEFPRECVVQSSRCAVKTSSGSRFMLPVGNVNFTMGSDSTVERRSAYEVALVKGIVLIEHSGAEEFKLSLGFADIILKSASKVLVRRNAKKTTVYPLAGKIWIQSKGQESLESLNPGFSLALAPVGPEGMAQMEVPQQAAIDEIIQMWGRLTPLSPSDFREELAVYHGRWLDAIDVTGPWHRHLAERQLASLEQQEKQRQAERARVKAENKRLRNLLRKKLFLDF